MTEIEFRRVYNFRLAVDTLLGFAGPRGYGAAPAPSRHGRVGGRDPIYLNARDCLVTTLLMPFGFNAQTDNDLLRALYGLTDEELSYELEDCREAQQARVQRPRVTNRSHRQPEEVARVEVDSFTGEETLLDRNGYPIRRRPGRRAVPDLSEPATEEYIEGVDADYVSNRSKPKKGKSQKANVRGIPEPPKPTKPKHKRRLVVGRKRPPVAED
jgi:hypothetical protein